MDVMFGQDGLRLSILRGEVFPHYDETTCNRDEDINLSLDDPFFDIDFNRDENRVAEGIAPVSYTHLDVYKRQARLVRVMTRFVSI